MKTTLIKLSLFKLVFLFVFFSCADSKPDQVPEQKADFCSQIHSVDSATLSKELEPIADSMRTKTGIYVLEDGDGAMVTRAWLAEHAEKTIDIQYFIFSVDNVGLIACDYLVRAADRGVKVRILVDDIMVEAGIHEILTMDSHENIEIKVYNPGVNLGKNLVQKLGKFAFDFVKANQRMHNKTFIVDDKVAITGGRNIADEYFDYDHEYNFRDRDVLMLGKVTGQMHASFEEFWNHSLSVPAAKLVSEPEEKFDSKNRFERLHQYACNPENFWPQVREKIQSLPMVFKHIRESGELVWLNEVLFVSDIPGKSEKADGLSGGVATSALMNLINKAKHSVTIQSPYLITTKLGQDLFAAAVKKGVKVRIQTNSLASTDNLEAFSGYQRCRKDLLEAGVEIYEFRPDAKCRFDIMTGALQKKVNYTPVFGLHAKSMVIDDSITVIGTFNLDPRSANLNTECFAIIPSVKVAKKVLQEIEVELKPENSWHTTLDWNPDAEAGIKKQLKASSRKAVPTGIL